MVALRSWRLLSPVFAVMALLVLLLLSGKAFGAGGTNVDEPTKLLHSFLAVFVITFGLLTLIAGIFTAYFGAGKSRTIGVVLTLIGLVVLIVSLMQAWKDEPGLIINWKVVAVFEAFVTVLGALVGAAVAVILFLIAIMKS